MRLEIPIAPLLALVGVEIGSNLACALLARRRRPRQAWLAAVMALDVLLFSGSAVPDRRAATTRSASST